MWRVKSLDAVLATAEKKSLHRSLGPIQLTLLGIGGVIGTGIFVLTAEAAQKAGPGMMMSFIIAGAVSGRTWLSWAMTVTSAATAPTPQSSATQWPRRIRFVRGGRGRSRCPPVRSGTP